MADLMEFVNTDTAKRLGEVTSGLQVALTRAKLFLADEELSKVVTAMSTFIDSFAEAITGPLLKEPRDPDALGAGFHGVGAFKASLRQLEDLAMDRLPRPVWHDPKG